MIIFVTTIMAIHTKKCLHFVAFRDNRFLCAFLRAYTRDVHSEIAKRLKEKAVYAPCRHSGEEVKPLDLHAVDPEITKYEFVRMLQERGVDILFHTYVVDTIMKGSLVKGVIVENKAGRQAILAKMVVDATGDADIAAFAGAPFRVTKKTHDHDV